MTSPYRRGARASAALSIAGAVGLMLPLGACADLPVAAAPAGVQSAEARSAEGHPTAGQPTAGQPVAVTVAQAAAATAESPSPATEAPVDASASATRADLTRLLERGEAAYRGGRADEAMAAFERVVSLEPGHVLAWLRIGNLHHQRNDRFKALGAYRRAAARGDGEGTDSALRAKALYNLALINLELAQQSLRTLERIGPAAAAAGPREPIGEAIRSVRRRLDVLAGPGSASARAASQVPSSRAGSAPAEPASPEAAPAPARRKPAPPAAAAHSRARSASESELPRIDYIRGAPKP